MTAINGTENEKAFISEELYEKLSKVSGKLEEGDILVTGGGSVGNPYIGECPKVCVNLQTDVR